MAIPANSCALTLSLLTLLALPASARLGETSAELSERFGPPVSVTPVNDWYQDEQFVKNGIVIHVSVVEDAAVAEQYQPQNSQFTTAQILALLQIDSQGHKWTLMPTTDPTGRDMRTRWHRDDGAEAMFSKNTLVIKTKRFLEGEDAFRKAQAPNIDGF